MLLYLHSGQTKGQSDGTEEIQDGFKCVVIAKNLSNTGKSSILSQFMCTIRVSFNDQVVDIL